MVSKKHLKSEARKEESASFPMQFTSCAKDAATICGVSVPEFFPHENRTGMSLKRSQHPSSYRKSRYAHRARLLDTIMDVEAQTRQRKLKHLRHVGPESRTEGRRVDE